MKFLSLAVLFTMGCSALASDKRLSRALVVCKSDRSAEDTSERLRRAIKRERDTSIFDEVDFQEKAKEDGERIDYNNLIVFGNPSLGAQVMLENRAAAIELPKNFIVFEDGRDVYVGYSPPEYMYYRFEGLDRVHDVLMDIGDLYERITDNAGLECYPITRGLKGVKDRVGLETVRSRNNFYRTWDKVLEKINSDDTPVELFFVVDHDDNDPRGKLPPTHLAVFGNVGAVAVPLIEERTQTVTIDLPLKILVWEDDHGDTYVTTNMEEYLKWRNRVGGNRKTKEVLENVDELLDHIVHYATN